MTVPNPFCFHGHELTPENTNKHGKCRKCIVNYRLAWKKRNPEKARENVNRYRKPTTKEQNRRYKQATRARNPEKFRAARRRVLAAYILRYPDKKKARNRRNNASGVERLADWYVAQLLGTRVCVVEDMDVLSVVRELVKFKREIRNVKTN